MSTRLHNLTKAFDRRDPMVSQGEGACVRERLRAG
jgi:hypothetical protein